MKVRTPLKNSLTTTAALAIVTALGLYTPSAAAKDASLAAIELYDGASGPAYIQLQNVIINGKIEMRDCTPLGIAPMDKSAYNKLEKLSLAVGGVLDRGPDGVLRYSPATGTALCVVPMNIKFDHDTPQTPAAMAEGIPFHGDPVGPGSDGAAIAPRLSNGVKLVFVAAPNSELAEFLLAQRATSIAGWQNYLGKFPSSPHIDESKDALTALFVQAGQKALSDYAKTAGSAAPAFASLKEAKADEDQAHALRPDYKPSIELAQGIRTILQTLTDKGRVELDAYNAALAAQAPGYGHLDAAKALAEGIAGVDSQFEPGAKLLDDVRKATGAFESALQSSASAAAASQMDDALTFVLPYRGFAGENVRVAKVIDATYKFHFDMAQQAETGQDWQTAVNEYEKASKTKDTAEVRDALKQARLKLVYAQDEAAATKALDMSKGYEAKKDSINAYEILSALTPAQITHLHVGDEMSRLAPAYIHDASNEAAQIAKEYHDIQGIDPERQIERALVLLRSAQSLTDDSEAKAAYQPRIENLVEELSAWFLVQAKHFLEKPAGSFTELGWAYLTEAESYKASNMDQVRDTRTSFDPAHNIHSKLSIRVQVLDQTSQRENTGLGSVRQFEDAIITRLDQNPRTVKAFRSVDPSPGGDPDFQLQCDVLEHEVVLVPSSVSKPSKYLVGTTPESNPDWMKANRAYEEAKDQVHQDEGELDRASAKNNKKQVAEVSKKLDDDKKLASDALDKRDLLPQNISKDEIRAYQYTEKTIQVNNTIKMQFSISQQQSGPVDPPVVVQRQESSKYVLIPDAKQDDVEGIKLNDSQPDTRRLQAVLEEQVREELKEKVASEVAKLPEVVFDEANKQQLAQNPEDAGEAYLRYLSVTPAGETPERMHAEQFLHEQFNFSVFPSVAP
jgi:hypothetical protein